MTTARRLFSLLSQAGTAAGGSRWFPMRIPENPTFPLGTYQFIAGGGDEARTRDSDDGDTPGATASYNDSNKLKRRVAQLTLYAKRPLQLDDFEAEIRAYVDGFSGTVDSDYLSVELRPAVDGFDTGTDLRYRHIDAVIWHRQT